VYSSTADGASINVLFFEPVVMFHKLHVLQPLCFMCNAFYIGHFPSQIMVYLFFIIIISPRFVPFNVKYNNLQSRNAYKYSAYFFVIKPTRCTNFTNLFWHETLNVSESSSVHHQEFIHCTLRNGIYMTSSFVQSINS
jgi:hypothetical protein